MPHITQKNKLIITAAILIVGSFFLLSSRPADAWGDYSKAWDGTLSATDWNNLPNDFLNKVGSSTMSGPLGINIAAPASGLQVNGPISGTSYVGSMSAGNISAGFFGSNTGGGNYAFPGNVGIGTSTPIHALDVVGDINLTGNLLYNGNPFSSSQWLTNGSSIYYNVIGGNVGIGTSAPGSRLTISGGDFQIDHNRSIVVNSNLNTTLLIGNYYDGQGFGYGTSTSWTASLAVEGDVKANALCIKEDCKAAWSDIVYAGGGGQWVSTGTDIYNANSGNVGVGTTAPNNKLQVASLINFNDTDFNTAVGKNAGANLVVGAQFNTFFGYEAGKSAVGVGTTEAQANTAIGYQALTNNTTGYQNTAVGNKALISNTTGDWNTAFGDNAMTDNIAGYSNMAFGSYALKANTAGNNNSAIGTAALRWNTTGSSNTANGNFALHDNTAGSYNVAIGSNASYKSTTSTDNVAIGADSLYNNTTGSYNLANGSLALTNNTTGSYNVALGYDALYDNTTGGDNIAIGADTMTYNTTGARNIAIGSMALNDLNIVDSSNSNNTAIGYKSGLGIVTGVNNTIIGANVGGLPAALSNNIIIADGAGNQRINVDASGNVGIAVTNPGVKLDVVGSFRNTLATTHSLLGGAGNVLVMADNTGTLYSTTTSAVINPIVTSASGWTANGTTVYKTDTNGNVGIGTTNPSNAKLVVSGNAVIGGTYGRTTTGLTTINSYNNSASTNPDDAFRNLQVENSDNTIGSFASMTMRAGNDGNGTWYDILYKKTAASDGIAIHRIQGNTVMTLNKSGNVGIGTTNPTTMLTLGGSGTKAISRDTSAGNLDLYGGVDYTNGAYFKVTGSTLNANPGNSSGEFTIGEQTGTYASKFNIFSFDGASTWTARLTVVGSGGNVGINTLTPGTKLDVAGSFRNTLATTHSLLGGSGNVIVMADNTGTLYSTSTSSFISNNGLGLWSGTKDGTIWNGSAGAGNVGIGTTAPVAQLQVEKSSYTSGQVLINNGQTGTPPTYPDSYLPALTVAVSQTSNSRPLFFGYDSGTSWNAYLNAGACGSFSQMCLNLGEGSGGDFTALENIGTRLQIGGGDDGNFTNVNFANSGNVGIGTTTPSKKFHVYGGSASILLTDIGVTDTNNNSLFFNAINGNPGEWQISTTNNVGGSGTSYLAFKSGNVGVGTTAPGTKLDVAGTSRNTLATTHSLLGGAGNVLVAADNTGTLYSTSDPTSSGIFTTAGVNLVRNADLAFGDNFWAAIGGYAGFVFTRTVVDDATAPVRSHKKVTATITTASTGDVWATGFNIENLKLNTDYNASCYFRTTDTVKGYFHMERFYADWTGRSDQNSSTFTYPNDGNWYRQSFTFNTGAYQNVDFRVRGFDVVGSWDITGCQLTEGKQLNSFVLNPLDEIHEGSGRYLTNSSVYGLVSKIISNNYSATNAYSMYVAAPEGTITNKYALATESGAGNVGIGTTAPGTMLDVAGSLRNSLATTHSLLGGGGNVLVMADNTGALYTTSTASFLSGNSGWTVNGTNVYKTDTNGNVGIGTTAPVNKLNVVGSVTIGVDKNIAWGIPPMGDVKLSLMSSSAYGINKGAVLTLGGYDTATTQEAFASIAGLKENATLNNNDGFLSFYTLLDADDSAHERMRITSLGNIGINTTTPVYKLDVNGSFRATASSSSIMLDANGDISIGI